MARLRTGYFKMLSMYANEADVIFIPQFSKGLCALEIAAWGREIGYGEIEYVPAHISKERPNAAAQA